MLHTSIMTFCTLLYSKFDYKCFIKNVLYIGPLRTYFKLLDYKMIFENKVSIFYLFLRICYNFKNHICDDQIILNKEECPQIV